MHAAEPVWTVTDAKSVMDVLNKSLAESVQLIRSNEMHLARKRGVVAHSTKPVSPRWLVASQRNAIIPYADAVEMLSRHERGTGRDTKR